MAVIEIENLTKDYGHNRGAFDVTFQVQKGEVYGFLGPNGAGKTTVIRHIMGFLKPQKGDTRVNGRNSWEEASAIQMTLGYLPGEIALPENLTGTQFLRMMGKLRGMKESTHTNYLLERFELDPSGSLKRMSLGMKRKLAIVTAFMHDPEILVLDEPTSGLDPIMQNTFIEFLKEEKGRGKTILLSSHIFSEADSVCDKISMIKEGHLISSFDAGELHHRGQEIYQLQFETREGFRAFMEEAGSGQELRVTDVREEMQQVNVRVKDEDINQLMKRIANYDLNDFSQIRQTLEEHFMKLYESDTGGGAGKCR